MEPENGGQHTFLFADLVGFTALTEAHGDRACAKIAVDFARCVEELSVSGGTEVVKTIGDEVMVHCVGAQEAVEVGRKIVERMAVHGSPPVRVGIHSGPAVAIEEDWFGATVNLASRVSGAARPGEVLVTAATRAELDPHAAEMLTPRGERRFKHVLDSVGVFTAARVGGEGHELEIDPVCRMAVDTSRATRSELYRGRRYSFCSEHCAAAFAGDPRRFVGRGRRAQAAKAAFRTHFRVFLAAQLAFFGFWALSLLLGGPVYPWFLFVLIGWGIPLALHYRAVRRIL